VDKTLNIPSLTFTKPKN